MTTSTKRAPRKDPEGGLTAAGRAFFAKKDGSNLKPGVRGKADTPDKMRRKGSFLRRHFLNPRGPMKDDHGNPTRLALSAHAWGEPIPKTLADAKKLAAHGAKLLATYAKTKSTKPPKPAPKKSAKKPAAKKLLTPEAKPKPKTKPKTAAIR